MVNCYIYLPSGHAGPQFTLARARLLGANMETVERIIEAATRLFNKEGIAQVSMRAIAEEVGISHSNLAYHFADKGEILDEIFSRMEAEMDASMVPDGAIDIGYLHGLLARISTFHEEYAFFYLDLLEIARNHKVVIRRYRKTIERRFEQHDRMMAELIGNGYLKREPTPGLYRSLFHAIWVMSTFWLQHLKILGPSHSVVGKAGEVQHVWEILLPYLTAKGLRQFSAISEAQPRPLALLHLNRVN
jgi:AcrR family transcriptional regulator